LRHRPSLVEVAQPRPRRPRETALGYAEGDPIPLPDAEDLTGQVVCLEAPFDEDSGDVYFTLYTFEHGDVSHLVLRFHERSGERYRITIEALAHDVEDAPVPLAVDTWIERQPPARCGGRS